MKQLDLVFIAFCFLLIDCKFILAKKVPKKQKKSINQKTNKVDSKFSNQSYTSFENIECDLLMRFIDGLGLGIYAGIL